MKKMIAITTLVTLAAVVPAHADDRSTGRKAGVFFSSALAGAVLAGPVGMIAAAAGGVWLDDKVERADNLEDDLEANNVALSRAVKEIDELNYRLAAAEDVSKQYAQIALNQLQMEMLFKTGDSELTASGKQRLAMLADFMSKHGELAIRLDGYADPRGDAKFNLALSQQRVESVAKQLRAAGLEEKRISTYSHGASQSEAALGDYDSYALERVVKIELSHKDKSSSLAQISLVE